MNVLITGGTGFIGSRLAMKCLKGGDSVRVLGQENNSSEAWNRKQIEEKGAEVISGSVTNRELVFETMQGMDIVYHLAAAQHEANVPDQVFWDVNVAGTKNILEASLNAGVRRLIHGSTIGVYGSDSGKTVNEQSPLAPDNIYGITKLEGEGLVRSFRNKLPLVIVRISETYGPGDRRLLKLFKGIQKNRFLIIGTGENIHHLIYIDDLIQGFFLAASTRDGLGKTFVLAGKEPLTTNQMVQVIAEELGKKIPRFHAPLSLFFAAATMMELTLRPLRIQPPLHRRRMAFFSKSFHFSNDTLVRHLGFLPRFSFREGVSATAKWYKEAGLL